MEEPQSLIEARHKEALAQQRRIERETRARRERCRYCCYWDHQHSRASKKRSCSNAFSPFAGDFRKPRQACSDFTDRWPDRGSQSRGELA